MGKEPPPQVTGILTVHSNVLQNVRTFWARGGADRAEGYSCWRMTEPSELVR